MIPPNTIARMQLARLSLVLLIASCASALKPQPTRSDSTAVAGSIGETAQDQAKKAADSHASAPMSPSDTPAPPADLTRERTLIDESEAARKASDYATARAKAAEAVTLLLARPEAEQDAAWLKLLNLAGRAAHFAQDLRTAKSAFQRVFDVRSRRLPDEHPDLQAARLSLAVTVKALGDLEGARALEEKVLEVQSRMLPDDHPDLQTARSNLAATLRMLGDPAGARILLEKVLEVRSRTLPDDHHDLQVVRGNLAVAIEALGDLAGARALEEKVLEVYLRTLPDDHPDVQRARGNLATTIKALGDLTGARALEEKVLDVRLRTLPDDHPDLQTARGDLAATIETLGDLAGARALEEKVLEVRLRTLPDEHPDLQEARLHLAGTMEALGDLVAARALEEKVFDIFSRTRSDDHRDLQAARVNLAGTMAALGDLAGARALEEKVLEVFSRTLPDEHPDVQGTRTNLAVTLFNLGDISAARVLFERVLEIQSRTLPDDHPDLQMARENLAVTIRALGDLAGARALEEKVLEVRLRTLPDEHPDLQKTRGNLAVTLHALGDFAGARTLHEEVLQVYSRTLPDEHPDLQRARGNLAATLGALGDLAGAQALHEKVLDVCSRTMPDEHPDLQTARGNLAVTLVSQHARARQISGDEGAGTGGRGLMSARCADLIGALCRAQVRAARNAILSSPVREAEERCSNLARKLDLSMSFASGYGAFRSLRALESESFVLAETTRGAAIVSAELTRRVAGAPRYSELRDSLGIASDELAALAQKGATSEEFDRARTNRESVERKLVALAFELSGGMLSGMDLDVESLAARLEAREAAVGFRRFRKARVDVVDELYSTGQPAVRETSVDSLCAFVVRSARSGSTSDATSKLTLVDLGPIESIEEAVRAWRDGLGVGNDGRGVSVGARSNSTQGVARGTILREKIFDPLLPLLAGARRVVVALDDVLHLVPLDALPADEKGGDLLGDRWRIETRATLSELMTPPRRLEGGGALLGVGGIGYGSDEREKANGHGSQPVTSPLATSVAASHVQMASVLRGGAWSGGFDPLPATKDEVESIASSFTDAFGASSERHVLERSDASKETLLELAPKARYVHLATHGWFAPESIKSWTDPEPLDKKSGLGMRMTGEEQVKGMSPMLLCGLALAGANLPENAVGRVPGLITADELSTLDLTNCELVVLSACDTNVGVNRAGQGVASLQKALQLAGARSVITSLWKVPDEATKELMLDFYRRLWVERKPKWQALWEAKKRLREAKDESGALKYTTRDWAAWVLTGNPE